MMQMCEDESNIDVQMFRTGRLFTLLLIIFLHSSIVMKVKLG
jgi:hypothetical protein